MNQSELIMTVASNSGESKKTVESVLKTAAEVIESALVEGGDVTLMGLGKLKAHTRAARAGRNPATGETMQIPEKKTVKFAAAASLTEAMNPAKKGKK